MRTFFTQFRRAPGRILASTLALVLAVAALGVLAVPAVTEGALHSAAERDGVGDLVLSTTPTPPTALAEIRAIPNVTAADGVLDIPLTAKPTDPGRVIGLAPDRSLTHLHLTAGRAARAPNEVVTEAEVAPIGATIALGTSSYTVVGHATTLLWSGERAVFADFDAATALASLPGANVVVIQAHDDDRRALERIAHAARTILARHGARLTQFPLFFPDGGTPLDQPIEQVSTLVGLLGIVAGLVALVLLASTTTTLITERTREVALMRALGGRRRGLQRRLRRVAVGITLASLAIGLPLGIVVSNLVGRLILDQTISMTPDIAVDWSIIATTALAMLVGARIAAARSARRVVRRPLAEALRDRDGAPFGGSWLHRAIVRLPAGGIRSRLAFRASWRRPARTVAVVAQIATAVGAAFLIPSLTASIVRYNTESTAIWHWESQALSEESGLSIPNRVEAGRAGVETGIMTLGRVRRWDVDAIGLRSDTKVFDPQLARGRWIRTRSREAVISHGLGRREHLAPGGSITLRLAGGSARYRVVGWSDDHQRSVYVDRGDLAHDLGAPTMSNVVWSKGADAGDRLATPVVVTRAADLRQGGESGRNVIGTIFSALAAILAGVAALAVLSAVTINLYERRHELALLRALGARRASLRGVVLRELIPLGTIGFVLGVWLGGIGSDAILGVFANDGAVDITVVHAFGSIPMLVALTLAGLGLLTLGAVRSAGRRSIATTLRSAA